MSEFRTKGDQARLEDLDGHDNVSRIEPVESSATSGRVYRVVFDAEQTDEKGRMDLLNSWAVEEKHAVLDERKWADIVSGRENEKAVKYVVLD